MPTTVLMAVDVVAGVGGVAAERVDDGSPLEVLPLGTPSHPLPLANFRSLQPISISNSGGRGVGGHTSTVAPLDSRAY